MFELHQLQHKRIMILACSALVFGYYAIWQIFYSLFEGGRFSQWDFTSKEFFLLACSTLIICVVITVIISSELDNRQITKAELYDQATDLPNGAYLNDAIKKAFKKATPGSGVGLLVVGVGGLESINETLGYGVGNQVIKAVSKRLNSQIGGHILLARISGDRFGLLFHNVNSIQPLAKCSTQLLKSIEEPVFVAGAKSYVDLTIGAVFNTDRCASVKEFTRQAELAFLHCKTNSDIKYAEFSDDFVVSAKRLGNIETGLREALETGQIDLHYQPLISSDLETMVGVEALARWKHPKLGEIPPLEFVAIAEALGLTNKLGNVVLREACRSINPIAGLKLAVNISPNHFLHPDFIQDVDHILHLTGFDPNRLEIEITESVLIGLTESAKSVVSKLQSRGISVALDDFGTGYSSLSYLNQFNVDRIKIDAEFIKEVAASDDAQTMFSSIFELATSRGFDVTVEGVESMEQVKFLNKHKNFWCQGYLFSKPLPYVDLILSDFLRRRGETTAPKPILNKKSKLHVVA